VEISLFPGQEMHILNIKIDISKTEMLRSAYDLNILPNTNREGVATHIWGEEITEMLNNL